MMDINTLSVGDIVEMKFHSLSIDELVHIAVDIELIDLENQVVIGQVRVVKNMPFDALQDKTLRVDLSSDTVQKDDHFGPTIGTAIQLVDS